MDGRKGGDEPIYLHLRLKSNLMIKKNISLFLFMIKPPFLKDWAMPNLITLTTNGSVLPVPGNQVFVLKASYDSYDFL